MQLHCIGAGRVGLSLGPRLLETNLLEPGFLICKKKSNWNLNLWPGEKCTALQKLEEARQGDMLLCAVGDDQLESMAHQLAKLHLPKLKIWHCSGAKGTEVFESLRSKGHLVASVHPALSFSNPEQALNCLRTKGPFACGAEGDSEILAELKIYYESMGFKNWIQLSLEQKAGYHLAQTLACNYWVLLLEQAVQSFASAGISITQSKVLLEPLLQATLENFLNAKTPIDALTGPAARGDRGTLNKHLDYAKEKDLDEALIKFLIEKTLHWKSSQLY